MKWYDEFATNCKGCGWLMQGAYQNGMPYLHCLWFGTIMKKQSGEECKAFRTPEQVERYLEKQDELAKKRIRK